MTLPQYIMKVGVDRLSLRLDLDESTVYKWKNWQGVPSPENAHKIVNLSMGAITYEEIYEPYFVRDNKDRQLTFQLSK